MQYGGNACRHQQLQCNEASFLRIAQCKVYCSLAKRDNLECLLGKQLYVELYRLGKEIFVAELCYASLQLVKVIICRMYLIIVVPYAVYENAGALFLRILKNLLRGSLLINNTLVHIEDSCTYVTGKTHLVCNNYHCHTLFCQGADNTKHLTHHCRVERRGRLIKQYNLRIH